MVRALAGLSTITKDLPLRLVLAFFLAAVAPPFSSALLAAAAPSASALLGAALERVVFFFGLIVAGPIHRGAGQGVKRRPEPEGLPPALDPNA